MRLLPFSVLVILLFCCSCCAFGELASTSPLDGDLYQESIALEMLPFASLAYCSPEDISSWSLSDVCSSLPIAKFQLYDYFNNVTRDSRAVIAYSEQQQTIVVSFKGTDPDKLVDWIDDLQGAGYYGFNCTISPRLSYRGDLGFCDYYLSMRSMGLIDQYSKIVQLYPNFQVYVVGHSLGGAAAAIFTLDILKEFGYNDKVRMVTFGQPRVGDISFDNLMMSGYQPNQIWRVIHDHDVVPHLAPCCPEGLFNESCSTRSSCPHHVPTEIWYPQEAMTGSQSTYKVCSTTQGEDPDCSNSDLLNWSISDHVNYFGLHLGGFCCQTNSSLSKSKSATF